MLYYYEKEDIILYFCPYDSQNGGDGVCFIQKMMDENHNSSNAKTTAPRILISSNTTVYLPTSHKIPVVLPQSPTHAVDCEIPLQFGFYPSVFRPPLV